MSRRSRERNKAARAAKKERKRREKLFASLEAKRMIRAERVNETAVRTLYNKKETASVR